MEFLNPFFHIFFKKEGSILHITGIICEYNPLHLGHRKQLSFLRSQIGTDGAIVCLMSGNFVQRGHPAIFDKMVRAQAAVQCGADLVLELPITYALSSAEGFAAGGVKILSQLCDSICFGAETADRKALTYTAEALLSPQFSPALRCQLEHGLSFPAARQAALEEIGISTDLLRTPNNILAVEYCKAILSQHAPLVPLPIMRQGSYHDTQIDAENPSATAIRTCMERGTDWLSYIPPEAQPVVAGATEHYLKSGEKAMLYRLRTMTDSEFEALPYGGEGLWRKFMHACRTEATLEEILVATKSKRYTRSRLDRMAMCAFLGITAEDMTADVPYTRVLAFTDKGRQVLKNAKSQGSFINAGQRVDHPYWDLEARSTNLHALFATNSLDPPGGESRYRIFYKK